MNNRIVLSKTLEFSVEDMLGATEVQISAPQPEQDQVAANESGENAQICPPRFEIVYQ